MKKIMFLLALCQLVLLVNFMMLVQPAKSDCPTGYACLLKDLKHQEAVFGSMQENMIKKHYDKPKFKEPSLQKEGEDEKQQEPPSYKELLPFSPRYY